LNKLDSNFFKTKTPYILLVRLLSVITTFIIIIFYSRTQSAEINGQFNSFWTQINVFLALGGLGLPVFVFTYSKQQLSQLYFSISRKNITVYLGWLTILGLLFSFIQLYSNKLFDATPLNYLKLIVFIGFLSASYIYEALNIIYGNRNRYLVGAVLYNVLQIAIYLLFYLDKVSINTLLTLLMWNAVLRWLILEQGGFKDGVNEWVNVAQYKKQWLNIGAYDISQSLIKYADKFILSLILSKEDFALYFLCTMEIPLFSNVFASVKSTVSMYLARGFDSSLHVLQYLRMVGKMLGYFIIPATIYLIVYSREFIQIFYSEQYLIGVPIFILSVLKMLNYNFVFSAVLQFYEKGAEINKGVWLDVILFTILSIILYQIIGLPGVALALLISTIMQMWYYTSQSIKVLNTNYKKALPIHSWIRQIFSFGILTLIVKGVMQLLSANIYISFFGALVVIAPIASLLLFKTYKKIGKL
jgi:O-antigen/teichoic acid export membrane protein